MRGYLPMTPKRGFWREIGEFLFAVSYLVILLAIIAAPFAAVFFAVRLIIGALWP